MVGVAAGSRVNKAEEASRGVERKGGTGVGKQGESLRRAVVLLATILFLAGCAVQQKIWFKPGVTDEQTQRDYDECLRRAEAAVKASSNMGSGALGSYGASGGAVAATEAPEMRSCMEGKGYRLVDRSGPRPPSPPTY
jgi:uncharacterized lipoprotein YajG